MGQIILSCYCKISRILKWVTKFLSIFASICDNLLGNICQSLLAVSERFKRAARRDLWMGSRLLDLFSSPTLVCHFCLWLVIFLVGKKYQSHIKFFSCSQLFWCLKTCLSCHMTHVWHIVCAFGLWTLLPKPLSTLPPEKLFQSPGQYGNICEETSLNSESNTIWRMYIKEERIWFQRSHCGRSRQSS